MTQGGSFIDLAQKCFLSICWNSSHDELSQPPKPLNTQEKVEPSGSFRVDPPPSCVTFGLGDLVHVKA